MKARGKTQVQVVFDTNTFWLSQQRMAELFGGTVPTINYHLRQIEQSGEIHLSDTIRKFRTPSDKWSGEVFMYNLNVVIAVGYHVNSYEATQFRIWSTQILKEYLTKGFVLDDERLRPSSGTFIWYLKIEIIKLYGLKVIADLHHPQFFL